MVHSPNCIDDDIIYDWDKEATSNIKETQEDVKMGLWETDYEEGRWVELVQYCIQ